MTPTATTKKTAPKKTRQRRTPEQIVADLEAQIAQVKQRAAAKETKQQPEVKPLIAAVRAVDKALEAAREAGNDALASSLEGASASLGAAVVELGLRVPQRRKGKAA